MKKKMIRLIAFVLVLCSVLLMWIPSVHTVSATETAVSPITISDSVVISNETGASAGLGEVNGHDYYYSLTEGKRMFVYDLDDKKMVHEINTGIGYPRACVVDKNGIVWASGDARFLLRYDPFNKTSTTTANIRSTAGLEETSNILDIWAAEDGNIYLSAYPSSHLVKYDPASQAYTVITQLDCTRITAVIYHQGYLYAAAYSSDSQEIVKVDASSGEQVDSIDITAYNAGELYDLGIMQDVLVAGGIADADMIAIDLLTSEMKIMDIGVNKLVSVGVSQERNGKYYFVTNGNGLYEYDPVLRTATALGGKLANVGQGLRTGSDTWVTIDGTEFLFTYTPSDGNPRLFDVDGNAITYWYDLTTGYGGPVKLRGFANGPAGSNEIYMGGFNTPNAVVFNTQTGTFTKNYVTGGQTDSQIWYNGELYAGNYSSGALNRMDLENNTVTNLITLNNTTDEQKRIHTLTAGDNKVFAGTTPGSGLNGGGIAWYDTVTGETKFHRNVIPNHTINCIVYHDGLIYGTTSTYGGSESEAVDENAVLFVYDYENEDVLATYDLSGDLFSWLDLLLGQQVTFIAGIAADPHVDENGRFWGVVSETLFSFTFDKTTNQISVDLELSFDKTGFYVGGSRQWFPRPIVFDEANKCMYVSFDDDGGMQQITVDSWTAEDPQVVGNALLMTDRPMFYTLGEDGDLYYASDSTLKMLPLNITDGDRTAAAQVEAMIDALGTAPSEKQIANARSAYDSLTWRQKALVENLVQLQSAETGMTLVAMANDVGYTTVTRAIEAAGTNGTVELVSSVTEQVVVNNGVTLNLKGNTITGDVIVTEGHIIDSGAAELGGIVGSVNVLENNFSLPLKEGDTYRFYEYEQMTAYETATGFYWFDVNFTSNDAYERLAANGTLSIHLTWNGDNAGSKTFNVAESDTSEFMKWVNADHAAESKNAMYVKVTGATEDITEITVTPVFQSDSGAKIIFDTIVGEPVAVLKGIAKFGWFPLNTVSG